MSFEPAEIDRLDARIDELNHRFDDLAEGQSRFMNSIFTQVNDLNDRVRGLEETVRRQQLMIDALWNNRLMDQRK